MKCLASSSTPTPKVWPYLTDDIREDLLLESELVLLSFATGIQDAASWSDYGCFASNQTGNALFLAIGAGKLEGSAYNLSHVGMSLGAFLAGGWAVGQIGNFFGVRKRLWLITSSAFQTALIYAAAAIQYSLPIQRGSPAALAGIFLLAFSSGAQVALGRSLKITDITTAMATAAFIDVVADPGILKVQNRQRNRRVVFLLMLIAGCFVGAFAQAAINSTFAILLCAICKTIVTFAFLMNKPIEESR
ncbi:hypothetical protein N7453_000693 [Penicillium expansum]|nr:hypothetical protein N7453_000693 [Penicillium expansum]